MATKKKLILFLIVILNILFARHTFSQSISTKGTDFWVSYMEQWCNPPALHVYITADELASGTISVPLVGWSENFTVPANSTIDIIVPSTDTAFVTNSETIENKGVHITTDIPVTVYALNYCIVSSDAAIVLPTPTLGREYYAIMYEGKKSYQISEFIIVGVQDNTEIEITPVALTFNNQPADVTFTITLNQGEVYFVKANSIDDATTTDLTGTHIEATGSECKTFAVFSGNKCAHVPTDVNWGDHLLEQMMPVKSWGKKYVTAPLKTRTGDIFRIIASEDGTALIIDGGPPINLNAGEFYEVLLEYASYIVADKPIAVAQFSRSYAADGVNDSDPFMVMVSPIEQTIDHIVFNSFTSSVITAYYLNLITTTANINLVTLDGIPMDTAFSPVPSNPVYSYAQIDLIEGNHIVHSDSGIIAYVYGYGFHESYGYVAGANVQNLALQFDIVIGGDTVFFQDFTNSICDGISLEFIAVDDPSINEWYWNFGDGSDIDTGMVVTHTFQDTGVYTISLIVGDICGYDSVSWNISVSGIQLNISDNASICQGDSVELIVSGAQSYIWEPYDGLSSTTDSNVIASPSQTTTYTVTGTDDIGCTGSISVTVTVNSLPNAETIEDQEICEGYSVVLTATGGDTYIWETGNTTDSIIVNPNITTTYYVTITSGECSAIDSVVVSVYEMPDVQASEDQQICEGEYITLTATGGTNYIWSTQETTDNISVNPSTSATYYVTVSTYICSDIDSVTITVNPLPYVFAGNDTSINIDESVQLNATENSSYTYLWNPSEGLSNINISNPIASPSITTIYYLTVIDNNNCQNTDNIKIKVIFAEIIITNTFTPNNDDINDTWHIENIELYPNSTVEIYNRNGNLVFSKEHYQNDWDGKYNNKNLPAATYYYIIDLGESFDKTYKGFVTIIR